MTMRSDNSGVGGERAQVLQVALTAAQLGLSGPIPANGNVQSPLLPSNGFLAFALGLTSSEGGEISIQRYIDQAGEVAQGAAITGSVTGGTAVVVNVTNDGKPFSSMQITVTNTTGAAATITNVAGLWQSAT
jgi:hypothetical protein